MDEGTPIGSGRYRLLETMPSTMPHVVRNLGHDTILDRDVCILTLTENTPHRQEVLEAASRAVLVDDPRIVRVLDVESDAPGFIVTEQSSGTPFVSLIKRGLDAEQIRTIIGETAQALDTASRRGLHHLALSPNSLRITDQGEVQVSGLGVEAALTGHTSTEEDPLTADRTDAQALISLLYYAHTGRWPGKIQGVPAAPLRQGKPVLPSTIADAVPAYVDDLCARAWSDNPPLSAAGVASELSPWESVVASSISVPPPPAPPQAPETVAETGHVSGKEAVLSLFKNVAAVLAGVFSSVSAAVTAWFQRLNLQHLRQLFAGKEDQRTELEPEIELDPDEIAEEKRVNHTTNLVLATLAVLVLVGMFFAINNLIQLSHVNIVDEEVPAAQTVPTSAQSEEATKTAATPVPAATKAATQSASPIVIKGAESLDPFGDNNEHPELDYALTDGDKSTMWYSRYYASASLAYKQGIGVAVQLKNSAPVSSITIDGTGEGGQVQIRSTSSSDPTGGTLLAQGAFTSGSTTFTFKSTDLQSLVIWVTQLPTASDGLYKLTFNEITLQ